MRPDALPGAHPACRYRAGLGLDPGRVGRVYGVDYCGESGEGLARGKVIIPVLSRGAVLGWQALVVPPVAAGPPATRHPSSSRTRSG